MKRGSCDITSPEKNARFCLPCFNRKINLVSSCFKLKTRKHDSIKEKQSNYEEVQEALQCLDSIIESEERHTAKDTDCLLLNDGATMPKYEGIILSGQHYTPEYVRSKPKELKQPKEIKYASIKGFDSFMMY